MPRGKTSKRKTRKRAPRRKIGNGPDSIISAGDGDGDTFEEKVDPVAEQIASDEEMARNLQQQEMFRAQRRIDEANRLRREAEAKRLQEQDDNRKLQAQLEAERKKANVSDFYKLQYEKEKNKPKLLLSNRYGTALDWFEKERIKQRFKDELQEKERLKEQAKKELEEERRLKRLAKLMDKPKKPRKKRSKSKTKRSKSKTKSKRSKSKTKSKRKKK